MTTTAKGLSASNPFGDSTVSAVVVSLPNYINLPPVTFTSVVDAQKAVLNQLNSLTIFAAETLTLETWVQNAWGKHTLYTATPNSGDSLTYNALTSLWEPTPVNRPLLSQLRVYNDATNILEVKRVFSGNALTNTSGLTTGSLTPTGVHTLTGSTNKSYRITIDGTGDWTTATFKWSSDAGVTTTASAVAIATGTVTGRKVLAPILLDNGVSVQFGNGVYTSGDYWSFVAIASQNQTDILSVNTITNTVSIQSDSTTVGFSVFDQATLVGLSLTANATAPYTTTLYLGGLGTEFFQHNGTTGALTWSALSVQRWKIDPSAIGSGGGMFLASLPMDWVNITTPSTPAATHAKLYSKGDKPYWLDSGGVESIIPQAAKAESITGTWAFSGTPTFTAATFTAATITTLTAPTIAGATTASGAWTFSAAGTAVAITNNATVGGTLGVTGVTTVGTINGTAGTMTALTITTLTAPTIAGATTASGAWSFTAAATAVAVTNTLTATTLSATNLLNTNTYDASLNVRVVYATSSPHITFTGDLKLATASAKILASDASTQITVAAAGVTIPTLLGTVTASGAWTFSSATGLAVTAGPVLLTDIAVPSNPAASIISQFAFAKASGAYQDTPRWLDSSGHDSGPAMRAHNIVPQPLTPFNTALQSVIPSATLGIVGMVVLRTPITLHEFTYNVGTVGAGISGVFRVALYTESGALITGTNVTDSSSLLSTGTKTIALGTDVYLPAGNYYLFYCMSVNETVTNPAISCYSTEATYQAVSGEDVLCGTVVVTGGAAPSPLGTITSTANRVPYMKLGGAST